MSGAGNAGNALVERFVENYADISMSLRAHQGEQGRDAQRFCESRHDFLEHNFSPLAISSTKTACISEVPFTS
jgi:predicted dinucleotide-binding enzyme